MVRSRYYAIQDLAGRSVWGQPQQEPGRGTAQRGPRLSRPRSMRLDGGGGDGGGSGGGGSGGGSGGCQVHSRVG